MFSSGIEKENRAEMGHDNLEGLSDLFKKSTIFIQYL